MIEKEYAVNNAAGLGKYLMRELKRIKGVTEVRGRGLMIGVDTESPQKDIRVRLLKEYHILTGYSGQYTLRLLPALTITRKEADEFLRAFREVMEA